MTILSYIATGVISAKVAIEYLHFAFPMIPVIPVTLILLAAFALLVISGVKDSAFVAAGIFSVHILTLLVFVTIGLAYLFMGNSFWQINVGETTSILASRGGFLHALFLAFSASLLGISGFESSANFVEEQNTGVFAKTLRNMWLGVSIFNPLIALVVLGALSLPQIASAKDFVLADSARMIGGSFLGYLIVTDAFLVLSGAVLTAYVGVSGLINRMALDGCLPSVLLKENSRGVHTRIIIVFFLLCSSILLITNGELLSLAGVYTISFLGVMSLFALGNLVLRETRTDLKRPYKAPLFYVVLAFLATATGVVGNLLIDPKNLYYFGLYFVPTMLVVFALIYKRDLFRFTIRMVSFYPKLAKTIALFSEDVLEGKFVVFVHRINRLYNALSYIDRNETGTTIFLVHCRDDNCVDEDHDENYQDLKEILPKLQAAGAFPHFRLNTLYINKHFGPQVVDEIAGQLHVKKNRIFIGSIHHFHDFDYHELGGVRIISG